MLGSFWELLPAIITVILVCDRTYLEDMTLKHELAGYTEYVKTVRYRLIPFIW
jgi:protein-S-isoprenylcysteine O-methyltransferase Ste14